MTNDKWYYFTDTGVKLTSEGEKIKKVVDSYNQYIKDVDNYNNVERGLYERENL